MKKTSSPVGGLLVLFMANMGATNGGCRIAFKKSVVEGNPRDVICLGNVHAKLLGSYN